MIRTHLLDLEPVALQALLSATGERHVRSETDRLLVAAHRDGARSWDEMGLGRRRRERLEPVLDVAPLLTPVGDRAALDQTRKFLWRNRTGDVIETVLLRNLKARTLCVSSQVGCALACTFCATGRIGLRRHLSPGEILESIQRSAVAAGERITDVVFMGQGEPLHNYDAVMQSAHMLTDARSASISRRRITISTAGLVPPMLRYAQERQPFRIYLSLHSAIQETRERLMPVARAHPLGEVLAALELIQQRCAMKWVTLQYVAIPGVNMDDAHVDALGHELRRLRYILNVIPYNDTDSGYRPPTWEEVREFTTRLRRLRCPVKTRYSGGKQEGMGCGQLSAEQLALAPTGGHILAAQGIFTR